MKDAHGLLTDESRLPRYYQVYLTLRDWIYNGNYSKGAQLPTETSLCDTFGVSRITVRKAVDLLASDDLVVREQGRGTFVTENIKEAPLTGDMDQMLRRLERLDSKSDTTDAHVEIDFADADTRQALNLSNGAEVQKAWHLRMMDGRPIGHSVSYIPTDLDISFTPDDLRKASMVNLLLQKGVEIIAADQIIGAALADMTIAGHLNCAVGTPLVRLQLVSFDAKYRPVERLVAHYLADFYQHRVHLVRKPGQDAHWMQKSA